MFTTLTPIEFDEATFLQDGNVTLPPMPAVMTALMEALHSGRTSTRYVADLIRMDPGITAQVLRVVNSAYYGLPRPISDITHSVACLGFGEVYRIVITLSVMGALKPDDRQAFDRIWEHSYHTALVAKLVLRTHERAIEGTDVHTMAVLHDVGKLIYQRYYPGHYEAIEDYAKSQGVFSVDAETHLGLPSHTTFGRLLCDRWRLPNAVRDACHMHELRHLPPLMANDATTSMLRVVGVSNLLARLSSGELCDAKNSAIMRAVENTLRCSRDELLLLMGSVLELRGEVRRFLDEH